MTVSNEQLRLIGEITGSEIFENAYKEVAGLNSPAGFIAVEHQLRISPSSGELIPEQMLRLNLKPSCDVPYPRNFVLNDPAARFIPEGSRSPRRAVLTDKHQRTVVFDQNGVIRAKIPEMPHFVQD